MTTLSAKSSAGGWSKSPATGRSCARICVCGLFSWTPESPYFMDFLTSCGVKLKRKCASKLCKLLNKYHTADPTIPFQDLVDSAIYTYNSSPHSAIWPHAPRDYVRAPSHFLLTRPAAGATSGADTAISKILRAARLRAEAALQNDIHQFQRRTPLRSATDVGRS